MIYDLVGWISGAESDTLTMYSDDQGPNAHIEAFDSGWSVEWGDNILTGDANNRLDAREGALASLWEHEAGTGMGRSTLLENPWWSDPTPSPPWVPIPKYRPPHINDLLPELLCGQPLSELRNIRLHTHLPSSDRHLYEVQFRDGCTQTVTLSAFVAAHIATQVLDRFRHD